MRKYLLLALAMTSIANYANAKNNIIFSCTTENGKNIEVVKVGKDYQFIYGELQFKNAIKQVVTNDKSMIAGGSGFISSSLELKHKGVSYTIDFAQPRNNPKEIDDPMLAVVKNDDTDIIRCDTSKKVYQNLERKIMRKSGFSF